MKRSLIQVRDLLLPSIHIIAEETGRELDLLVNYANDSITLISTSSRDTLFTRKDISDGLVQTELRKRVEAKIK